MRQDSRLPLFFLTAALGLPAALPAASPTDAVPGAARPARVTIRGTGNAISVERAGPAPAPEEETEVATVLDEAVRMKESGTSDEAVVGYLRAHRSDLPSIVGLGDVSALRDAGAGRSVVAYLSTVAAVEIGPTGAEGRSEGPEDYGVPPEPYMTNELPADLAWGGWGWGGGVIANGDFGSGHRHGRGGEHRLGRPGHGPGRGIGSMPHPAPRAPTAPAPPPRQSVRGIFRWH